MKEQARLNQLQEDEMMREWVAQEDTFVLKQAKKKAEIRVKEGRAKPIDWLAVTLRVIDPTRNPLDDEIPDSELDLVDPEGVFEGLSQTQLAELEKDIDTFLNLETNAKNRDFWKVCFPFETLSCFRSGSLSFTEANLYPDDEDCLSRPSKILQLCTRGSCPRLRRCGYK